MLEVKPRKKSSHRKIINTRDIGAKHANAPPALHEKYITYQYCPITTHKSGSKV